DEKKCSKLKRGEFFYAGRGTFSGSRIVRGDSMQSVTDAKTGEVLREKIVWIDPCTYLLYPFPDSKAEVMSSNLFPISISILEVTERYYTVHVVSWDRESDFKDTAWILRTEP